MDGAERATDHRTSALGDATVGYEVVRAYSFTADAIKAYAVMAGDTNRLHLDEAFATESRFGGLIACAAHSTGVLMSVLADVFSPNGEAVGLGFDLMLRRAVTAGTEAELAWTVTERAMSDKLLGEVVTLAGEVREARTGKVFVKGTGRLLVL